MKKIALLIFILLTGSMVMAQEQRIFVNAIDNCIGKGDGTYKKVKVKPNVTYALEITSGKAIFNTKDNAEMANLGVLFVKPPREMTIKPVEKKNKTYVVTEGNLLFFFVDDPALNKGGFYVTITEVNH